MYWRMVAIEAPPQLPEKQLGDHKALPHNLLRMLGKAFLRIRWLDTPLRLLTNLETATLD